MVKAEPDRDYYADLDLPPSASANDIKKQFKKLALQFHPDRNHDDDTTAKFQAIQSANEILTDPQQRAKYDAQRIRSGQLHSYAEAPPPPPPRRPYAGFSNFPPPPPPPPMSAKKSTFSTTSSASGPHKYTKFNAPDPPSWRTRPTDDAKAKTNDFKAWEHMRHGQGPLPRGRKEAKPTSFQPEREFQDQTAQNANSNTSRRTTQRKTDWENLSDAGMPHTSRGHATRTQAKTSTYSPTTPGVGNDEPQARSAYFKTSQDRPAPSRVQSTMPPPQSRAPTAKRPDPLKAFKTSIGANDLSGGAQRPHTQYPSVRGEKTNLSPGPGLHRSSTTATPRENNHGTASRDNDTLRANGSHVRSASASSPFRSARTAKMASASTTSSESSSDDDDETTQRQEAANLSKSVFDRPKQRPDTRRPHVGAGAPQRSFFNPRVTVDEARDEPMVSDAGYSASRRHSGVEFPTQPRAEEPPVGFGEHRKKHEASHSQQGFAAPNGKEQTHFMQRPRSFDEHYRRSTPMEEARPQTANKESTPMYESGFRWGAGDLPKAFNGTPSLRSQSTENIDVKFSPSVHPPKFGEGSGFSSTQASDNTSDNPIEISDDEASPKKANGEKDETSPGRTPVGPPPKGPACFYPNDWHQRAWAGTFQADAGGSQSRASSQRRPGTPRAFSKRTGLPKSTGFQPTVDDAGDEPPSYSTATSENLSSSRVSSEGSAMDIDPVLTPPSGNDNQQHDNAADNSPSRPPNGNTIPPNHTPNLPPRTAVPLPPEPTPLNFSFNDFQNVKPFAPSGEGLSTIDDLTTALPFESRPSFTRPPPADDDNKPALKLPKPPKAPSTPKPLNPTTWQSYITAMAAYIRNWSNFNNAMLSHFHIRQEAQKQLNSNPNWMSVRGDGDFDAYVAMLAEDERVRKWWEVACDRHRECVEQVGRARVGLKAEMERGRGFAYPG